MADNFDASTINSWWNTPTTTPRATTSSSATASTDASIIDQSPSSSHLNNILDSSFHSNFMTMDQNYWNQSLLTSSTSSGETIRAEPSFRSMLQDPMTTNYVDPSMESGHHQFLLDHHHHHHHHQQHGLPMRSPGLFEAQQPVLDQGLMSLSNYQTNDFWNNNINTASDPSSTTYRQVIYPSVPVMPAAQFGNPSFEQKPSCSSRTSKSNSEGVSKRSGSGSGSSSSSTEAAAATALKKPRVQTPSPFPTFKVRKEKLGDRITALQQLVSPFGKTDTASVLHEAIEYIKFLHDQVNVLSTPYLKNGHPMQQQQSSDSKYSKDEDGQKQDLRSRGLCLVPIECTYPVTSETTADFWTPTFGGSYR